jgi:hypothetical protein
MLGPWALLAQRRAAKDKNKNKKWAVSVFITPLHQAPGLGE